MDSNTHPDGSSTRSGPGRPDRRPDQPDRLAPLATAVDGLAAQDLHGLSDAALAAQVLALRGLLDRREGHWLQQLAAGDGRGAAGADHDHQHGSTAAWLRSRLRMGPGRPPAVCGRPGRCSGAPCPRPPGP